MIKLVVFLLAVINVGIAQETCSDYKSCIDSCFSGENTRPSVPFNIQGPPGYRLTVPFIRRGRKGSIGPKGEKGDPGVCQCDQDRISELERKIAQIIEIFKNSVAKVQFCSLGVKAGGNLPNSSLTASSAQYPGESSAEFGRLNTLAGPGGSYGGWLLSRARRDDETEWIQVDLGNVKSIHTVVTQGSDTYDRWVETYKIETGKSSSNMSFVTNEDTGSIRIFQGNSDNTNMAFASFEPPIEARYFRIYPVTYYSNPVLRFDLLGC